MGQKNVKETVSILNDSGRIRLRWRVNGTRYSINTQAYNKQNLYSAKKLALQIEEDLRTNQFDKSLVRYKKELRAPVFEENKVAVRKAPVSKPLEEDHVGWFETWTKEICNMDCEVNKNYNTIRNMLRSWGNFSANNVNGKLRNSKINNRTYNRRLTTLVKFYNWVVKRGYLLTNPLEDVQRKTVKKVAPTSRRPFTTSEITAILKGIKYDTYCHKSSSYKHSHYYPFAYFIFKTGVRNAEAVGLRVNSVDLTNNLICIKEVMARTLKGTNAAARVRKETKNGMERYLPLTVDLREILLPLIKDKGKDELVFQSYTGLAIDDKMFQRRILSKVLQGLNISKRVLYACRHTFGSRCIAAGIDPIKTSILMGNLPETVMRNYVHPIEAPEDLPPIDI